MLQINCSGMEEKRDCNANKGLCNYGSIEKRTRGSTALSQS